MSSLGPVSRFTVMRCLGPRLAPFFKMFALFYILFPKQESNLWFCVFKCAPILYLALFVYMYGVNLPDKHFYSLNILWALIFSCIGDAFLVWSPKYLIIGMIFFLIAHLLYIYAFGLRPFKLWILCLLLPLLILICINIKDGLTGMLTIVSPVYATILTIMLWRGLAQLVKYENTIPWTSIACAVGAILFAVSDSCLAITLFIKDTFSIFVLPTYYAAQLCFAVSVVDSQLNSLKAVNPQSE